MIIFSAPPRLCARGYVALDQKALDESIKNAVKYCLENDILTGFLRAHEGEVVNMILDDLTTEEWMDLRFEEGREQGLEQGNKYVLDLIAQGLSAEQIKQQLEQKA